MEKNKKWESYLLDEFVVASRRSLQHIISSASGTLSCLILSKIRRPNNSGHNRLRIDVYLNIIQKKIIILMVFIWFGWNFLWVDWIVCLCACKRLNEAKSIDESNNYNNKDVSFAIRLFSIFNGFYPFTFTFTFNSCWFYVHSSHSSIIAIKQIKAHRKVSALFIWMFKFILSTIIVAFCGFMLAIKCIRSPEWKLETG